MKKKQFSTEQIVAVLKQAEMGMAVADLILAPRDIGPRVMRIVPRDHAYAGAHL